MIFVLAAALLLTAWRYGVLARRRGIGAVLRAVAVALAAGSLAGVVLGLSARVAMRLLALGTGAAPRLSAEGTSAVVVAFTGVGVAVAFPYAGVVRSLVRRPALAYAALLAAVTFPPFLRTAAQDLGAGAWDARVIGGTLLVSLVMWVPYALVLEAGLARLSRLLGVGSPAHNAPAA
jgi:hypothetical protein